jgi:hypothetical protein
MSLKMSLAPQAPCIFKTVVCARLTLGIATVAAAPAATAVAPVRKRRRVSVFVPAGACCAALITASRLSSSMR